MGQRQVLKWRHSGGRRRYGVTGVDNKLFTVVKPIHPLIGIRIPFLGVHFIAAFMELDLRQYNIHNTQCVDGVRTLL